MHIDLFLAHRFLIEQFLISCKHIQFAFQMCNWGPLELMFQTWMANFDLWLFPCRQFLSFDYSCIVANSNIGPQWDIFVLRDRIGNPLAVDSLEVATHLAYSFLKGYVCRVGQFLYFCRAIDRLVHTLEHVKIAVLATILLHHHDLLILILVRFFRENGN